MLESVDGLGILLGLCVHRAEEVPGVGIVGIDLSDAAEGVYRGLRIARVFIKQAEVIPGMRVGGITFDRFFEKFLGLINPTQAEQGDALIQARGRQLGIARSSVLKGFQSFREGLLVHVSNAQIIQTSGFGGGGGLFGCRGEKEQGNQQK